MNKGLGLLFAISMVAAAGMGFAAGHGSGGTMLSSDAWAWQDLGRKSPVKMIVLWGDPATGEHGRLLKVQPGISIPAHSHSADFHAVNLRGTWRHSFLDGDGESRDLPPGSYVFQPGGGFHRVTCVGPAECVLFIDQRGASDFTPLR